MAPLGSKRRAALLYAVHAITSRAEATPTVAFPFNSQVPTVARVGGQYNFQFSASTLAPENTNFTYSLSDQPAWLTVDSATRTLSGAPSQADAGASTFTLTAADSTGAAHMPCTLVISTDPPPQIEWGIGQQLATIANLSSSQPPVVTVLPSQDFKFDFRQNSFIDIVQRKLYYYATLADHTPLPAWLLFNTQDQIFFGTAPELTAFPQSWDVALIASDVEGFAGTTASFTISVAMQQLVFVPEQFEVNITDGMQVDFTALQHALFLNGNPVPATGMKSVHSSAPGWLHLDDQTLALTGTVPEGTSEANFTVVVTDGAGNQATADVQLATGHTSLFTSQVVTLTAHAGKVFQYSFPSSMFSVPNVVLMVTFPAIARWLSFDSSSRTLSGQVPDTTSSSTITATLTAKNPDTSMKEVETFTIDIVASTATGVSSTATSHSAPKYTTSALGPTDLAVLRESHSELSKGAIVAIAIASLIVVTLLVSLFAFCRRRRRKHHGYVDASSPAKRTISRPILPSDANAIMVTTQLQRDVENTAGSEPLMVESRQSGHAPRLSLGIPVPSNSKKAKKNTRFSSISHVSSLGNGEDAIRADSNIPEWGRESAAMHTPHDSFSVPAEIARSSRQPSDLSPSKRALRRLRERHQSRQSVGLGIDIGSAGPLPRHSSRGARGHRKAFSSLGHSTIPDGSSVASFSTRGTSVLSTRPSDFPRPPTRSTFGGIRSVPAFSLTESDKRKSIRFVGRSDSILDERSLQEKRQSFIRNRASTSLASPLFSHGSRVSTSKKQNRDTSVYGSTTSSLGRSNRGRSQITTYSESSSIEPPPRDSRRLSTRLRSTFAPNFPRAITKSTLGADNEDSDSWSTLSSQDDDLAAQLALPRHQRNFVVPGEASPTPPPAPPASLQGSSTRNVTPLSDGGRPRQKWKERLREHSSSPLSTAVVVPVSEGNSPNPNSRTSHTRRSRLSEPLSLVSNDSLSRGKVERPRLVQTNIKRPVSVEKVQRLSSLKADTEDTRPGSEMWEAMEGAGLMPPNSSDARDGTQRSNMSGPAFL